MIYALATLTADYNGNVTLTADPQSTPLIYERRLSRTATLDGKSVISDLGFTASDNTLKLKIRVLSEEQRALLIYLIQNYGELLLFCEAGVFKGAMNTLRPHHLPVTFEFLIAEQLA